MNRITRDHIEALTDRWLDQANEPVDDDEQDRLDAIELDRAEARAESILDDGDW